MKITRYFIAAATMLMALTACNSDLEKVTYNPANATSGQLTASETDIRLTAATTKQDVLTLTWGESNFDIPVAIVYTIEMDARGGNFENAYTLASVAGTSVTFTGKELNNAILAFQKQINPDTDPSYDEQAVDIRVSSTFSKDVEPKVSNTVAMNITPYAGKLEFAKMAVPGAHQGWDPTNYTQALYATDSSKPEVYEGYIYLEAGNEFKFADGSWDVNWGSSDGKTLEPGGPNIKAEADGCYYIKIDIEALTYSMEISNWSLVGDAIGGWDKDIDMTYDKDNNLYRAIYTFDGSGQFKFRANHDWARNYGVDPDGDEGDLKLNGDNITPLPGEYTVTLSFVDGYPKYSLFAGGDVSKFKVLNVPGSMNGWKADTEDNILVDMKKTGTYSGWVYASGDDEFKFALGSWDENWGCSDITEGVLVPGGDNIKPATGMYYITVNLDDLKAVFTKTSWTIIGDAVGGWDTANDVELTWNSEKKVYEATVKMSEGGFKFRANQDWAINLGGADGNLAQDGANIAVEAGTYYITLDLQTTKNHLDPTYTITKQ
ncbi:MAG: SusF/SusE family outer membrane protein [Prevotella sp.]|nr:SusF/SusE family outer membrane protein [Prevotella sp.]